MATLQDYLGITALRDAWPRWKANVIAVNNQVIAHVAGTADKHAAQDITYTGDFVGKTEIKAAIDQAKTEIDTIVISASIDPEVAFARDSAVKGTTFATLDARLEESEQDHVSYKADNALLSINALSPPSPLIGLVGDGVNDDTTAYNDLMAYFLANGGGVLIFPPLRTYRIGDTSPTPDNLTIYAYGANFKATDTSSGKILHIMGSSVKLYGGHYDGNWDGGVGSADSWLGATGVIADNGSPGDQPVIGLGNSNNCLLEDVTVINSVNDGISGSHNNNLTLRRCLTENTSEHGYYFSYSENIKAYDCETINNGLNNYGKGSVMFKMREGKNYYLYNFKGSNIDPQSLGGFTEGSGVGLYVDGLTLINIRTFIYFLLNPNTWGGINKDISIKNFNIVGNGTHEFSSFTTLENGSLANGFVSGFISCNTFHKATNIKYKDVAGVIVGHGDNYCECLGIEIENSSERVSLYGSSGSIFDVSIYGETVPLLNRIYAKNPIIKQLSLVYPIPHDTYSGFLLYDGDSDILIHECYFENIGFPLRNSTVNVLSGNVTILSMTTKGAGSFLRDTEGSPKVWNIVNAVSLTNMGHLFYFTTGVIVKYGKILLYGTKTALSFGSGTATKIIEE